jgi:shikimate dehydrogenase
VISGATRVAAVIGSPVAHSRSPAIHNAGFAAAGLDWVYVALEVPPGSGADAVRAAAALGLGGLSVTMPHKADAADACDELTPAAATLRSVNTVVVRDDRSTLGDSTDGEGFLRALADEGLDPSDRSVLLLGAGGAARAVAAALVGRGARVAVAARRPGAAAELAAMQPGVGVAPWPGAGVPTTADVVVNATPVGMGTDPGLPVEPRADQWVVDLVYHPLETPLLAAARAAGATTIDGLGMLVHQAALAFERWTGVPAPLAAMRAAAAVEPT